MLLQPIVTLVVVEYQAYLPASINYRAEVDQGTGCTMRYEQSSWSDLFALLDKLYPGIEYEMPDEIDTIRYDNKFIQIR